MAGTPRRVVETPGLSIACRDAGGPPGALPLLLLHGAVQTARIWDGQFEALARHRRVVAPDLRGHGETAADPATISVERMARDGLALLDALSIERAAVCGVSLGGMVALEMAALAPRRVEALVVANTPLALSLSPRLRAALETLGPQRVLKPAFALLGRRRTGALGLAAARRLFGKGWVGPETERHFVAGFGSMDEAAILSTYAAIVAADPARLLPLAAPCVIVLGTHETGLVRRHAALIAERLGHARIVTLEGGHVTSLDSPDAFVAVVEAFLASEEAHPSPQI